MQALPLGIIEMDPVSEDAAFAGELIVMIDIQSAHAQATLFNPAISSRFSLRCVCSGVGKLGPQALHGLQQPRG